MTSVSEIDQLLMAPRESTSLEFKEAKQQYDFGKLLEYCIALANEGGGKIILGVTDGLPRVVVGSNAFATLQDVETRIFDKLRFRVDSEEVLHPKGRIVIFHIPGRPKGTAYHLDGRYLMRSGDHLVPMSEDRLRAIFSEGGPNWLLMPAMSRASPQDIVDLLETQSYFDLVKLPYPEKREAVLDRLAKEKLIHRTGDTWSITNLGAILFAKKLDAFDSVRRKAVRVIVYTGADKLSTRLDRTGAKGYAVGFEGLIEFIDAQVPTNEVIGAALRTEIKMFPREAIRELLANAIIHQDFGESGTSVNVEIYADRMEISNPGRPFIPTDRFIDDYQSRNDLLADLMRRLGICEEKGSGIDRVVKSAEDFQLPAPDFRASERRTTVVLFGHIDFAKMTTTDRVRACYQHCVLRYVTNERMTNESLRARFKLPKGKTETASRIIREAVDEGKVKREDSSSGNKFARYVPFWA